MRRMKEGRQGGNCMKRRNGQSKVTANNKMGRFFVLYGYK